MILIDSQRLVPATFTSMSILSSILSIESSKHSVSDISQIIFFIFFILQCVLATEYTFYALYKSKSLQTSCPIPFDPPTTSTFLFLKSKLTSGYSFI